MSRVWDLECENHTQKLVLLALADNANDQGKCWPSITTIARKCQLSRRSVFREIIRLKKRKLVKRESGGGRQSNHYIIVLTGDNVSPVTTCHRTGDNGAPPPVTGCHPTGDNLSPKPSGTVKEPPRGTGPPKTINEVEKQIHRQTEAMEKFRYDHTDGGNKWTLPGALEEYRKMKQRKEALENELRNM